MSNDETAASAVLARMRQERGYVLDGAEFAAKAAPEFVEAYDQLYAMALGEKNPVPVKIREFVAIGILLFRGATEAGIARHMKRAMAHGATIEELLGVVQSTIVPGGAPAYNRGIKVLAGIAEEGRISGAP